MRNFIYNLFSEKFYWYAITVTYRSKVDNSVIFNRRTLLGFRYPETILKSRHVKRAMLPLHEQVDIGITNDMLQNGFLEVNIDSFLGKMNQSARRLDYK
jgi:hypothetical protein